MALNNVGRWLIYVYEFLTAQIVGLAVRCKRSGDDREGHIRGLV